jgi:hypothetical protein
VRLTIPLRGEDTAVNAEDLSLPCNLLVRYTHDRGSGAEHFRLPLVFPAGTLPLNSAR